MLERKMRIKNNGRHKKRYKNILFLCLYAISILILGCTSNRSEIEIPVLMSESEEKELMVRWYGMYNHESFGRTRDGRNENDAMESFEFLKIQGIHPLRIYKGSMIFFHEDYGFLFLPSHEGELRQGWPKGMEEENFADLADLLREHDGKWVQAFPTGRGSVISFKTVEDMESFVSELWS